jgi:hypothetical protein
LHLGNADISFVEIEDYGQPLYPVQLRRFKMVFYIQPAGSPVRILGWSDGVLEEIPKPKPSLLSRIFGNKSQSADYEVLEAYGLNQRIHLPDHVIKSLLDDQWQERLKELVH